MPFLLGIGDDGNRTEELEGGFPQVKGRQVPLQGRLGIAGAAIQLREGQREPPKEAFIGKLDIAHESSLPLAVGEHLMQQLPRL